MKKITKNLMFVAAAATALSAGAEATWEFKSQSKEFLGIQSGRGVIADFTNNGHLDIYYSGSGNMAYYDHKGLWNWQASSNMLINKGDGTFDVDIIGAEPTGEFDENDLDGDGNPKEWWRYVDPKHGIIPTSFGHYATFDYNNDGLVDLLVMGVNTNDNAGYINKVPDSMKAYFSEDYSEWKWDWDENGNWSWLEKRQNFSGTAVLVLYKNLGDGRFELVENCNLPVFWSDGNQGRNMGFKTIAWGDYDHDGYVDIAFSGVLKNNDPGTPGRVAQLWRNLGGTGEFKQMNIATTKGGTWTNEVKGDDDTILINSEKLDGWFLLLSGNVNMVDINNDGWLDLIFDGWTDKINDDTYEAGSNGRVYLNQDDGNGGREFIDVTDPTGNFYLTRSGGTELVDLDGDGYLDILNGGYGDHGLGWKTLFFHNNIADDPENITPEEAFTYGDSMDQFGLANEENFAFTVKDFDGDGILDIQYNSKHDGAIHYGQIDGTYSRSDAFHVRGWSISDGFDIYGDLNGNGLVDRFQTGYGWIDEEYRGDLNNGGDWAMSRWLWHNTTDVEIIAPDVPANVKTSIDETAKTVTIEWDDVESPNCAYNVVVLTPSGKVIANLPVDPVTGFIKVAENKNIAIRPFVNKYTLPYNEVGEYKMGVQAVSLNNEKASAIAWGQNLVAGVGNITTDLTDNDVKVTVNGNTIVANATANADVKVIDMMGRTIATGVTNTPISVEANGVLIVNVAGKSVKVVK